MYKLVCHFSMLNEHHLLTPCERLSVVVYDHEPSSIIAYSLRWVCYIEHNSDFVIPWWSIHLISSTDLFNSASYPKMCMNLRIAELDLAQCIAYSLRLVCCILHYNQHCLVHITMVSPCNQHP